MRTKKALNSVQETSMFANNTKDERVKFRLSESAYGGIIDRLTDVYDTPAISFVRELISNAYDALVDYEKEYGTKGNISIQIPSMENSYTFSVTDNGKGMSKDFLINVTTSYGDSPKLDDINAIGAYGLGFKSPFAAVSVFHIETSNGEETTTATAVRNPGEVPELINIKQTPAHGKHGTTITVPMKNSSAEDRDYAVKTALIMSRHMVNYDTIISNEEELAHNKNNAQLLKTVPALDNYVHIENIEHNGEHYRLFLNKKSIEDKTTDTLKALRNPVFSSSYMPRVNNTNVVLNGFVYPLENGNLAQYRESHHTFGAVENTYLLEIAPGVVDFPSSRDTVVKNGRLEDLMRSLSTLSLSEDRAAEVVAKYLATAQPGMKTVKVIEGVFKSKRELASLADKAATLNGTQDLSGNTIDIDKRFVTLIDMYRNSDKYTMSGVFFSNKELKSRPSGAIINTLQLFGKTEINDNFRRLMKNYVLNNNTKKSLDKKALKDVGISVPASSVIDRIQDSQHGDVVLLSGNDPKYIMVSDKAATIFNVNKFKEDSLLIFPLNGKLSKKEQEMLDTIVWATRATVHNIKDYQDLNISGYSTGQSRGVNDNMEYIQIIAANSLIDSQGQVDEKDFYFHVNKAISYRAGTRKAVYGRYSTILERIDYISEQAKLIPGFKKTTVDYKKASVPDVLIVPKQTRFDYADFVDNAYNAHMHTLVENYGIDYAVRKPVLIFVEPNLTLIKELKNSHVNYTVHKEKQPYKTKTLNEVAVEVNAKDAKRKSIISNVPQEELTDFALSLILEHENGAGLGFYPSRLTLIMLFAEKHPEMKNYNVAKEFAHIAKLRDENRNTRLSKNQNYQNLYLAKKFMKDNSMTLKEFFAGTEIDIQKSRDKVYKILQMNKESSSYQRTEDDVKDTVSGKKDKYLSLIAGEEKVESLKCEIVDNYIDLICENK